MRPITTPALDQVDELHGELVADPYRWLEDTYSPETLAWVEAQNARTEEWLAGREQRQEIRDQLSRLWDYARSDPPFERGGRWFQWRNSGLQDQAVLYVVAAPGGAGAAAGPDGPGGRRGPGGPDGPGDRDGPGEVERVLLDSNTMSADGTVSVASSSVSEDGALVAYATSEAGSDWMTWHVRDVATGRDGPDRVEWAKFSGAAWRPDGSGFYYSSADKPAEGAEYTEKTGIRRVNLHVVGTGQQDDRLVFERPDQPEWSAWPSVPDDGDFLVITISKGTAPETRVEVTDLSGGQGTPVVLVPDFNCEAHVVTNVGRTFFLLTDHEAERRRVVAVDLDHPEQDNWREVVPQQAAALTAAVNCGGKLICHYLEDACSRLSVYSLDGGFLHDIQVPAASSVQAQIGRELGLQARPGNSVAHFAVQSYTDPGSLWSHDVATATTTMLSASQAHFETGSMLTEMVFVVAGDGARVPLFLTRRADAVPDGKMRVLLYGYGGFDIAITPWFDRANALFVQRGGMLAVACLRGGGEYGRSWHDAGRLAQKQRVFDDFCDCARWLVSSGWSGAAYIGINGASNGGLLVGACLTQHPELFGAAVPEVGVMDMLRFHKFTIGWAWKSDFGDPDEAGAYQVLKSYSPLHNIKQGVHYPATLVMTGDHDDRVVPGHSFKFAATLQAAQSQDDRCPILIRVETSAGHGHGKPTSKAIAERSDMLTFLEWALSGPQRQE